MAAAQAPASRSRRYVYGGLLAAAAVAIGLALIFTVGGAGKKEAKSVIEPSVEQLEDHTAISDVLKDLTAKEEAPATTTVTPVAPAAPAPEPGMNIGTFTPVRRTRLNCRPKCPP